MYNHSKPKHDTKTPCNQYQIQVLNTYQQYNYRKNNDLHFIVHRTNITFNFHQKIQTTIVYFDTNIIHNSCIERPYCLFFYKDMFALTLNISN